MKISYLMGDFGFTGGSMVLYKFMDKLSEQNHEVYATTPFTTIQWKPGYSKEIVKKFSEGKRNNFKREMLKNSLRSIKKFVNYIPFLKDSFNLMFDEVFSLKLLNKKLIENWIPSDITISTYCLTAFANFYLMDKTTPLYHMQHYEELFFDNEVSQKIARLTYLLPIGLISNSTWLKNQIAQRFGRDSYLLNPGIDTEIFYPQEKINDKYKNPSKIYILSYYSPVKFKAWEEAVKAMEIVFNKTNSQKVEWIVYGGTPIEKPKFPVNFVGKIFGDSLAKLYSKAHIVFMNSWYESFPLPPIEAMACGTAVVTTQFGVEDYAFNGINAIVIPPGKPELLANEILMLVDNLSYAQNLAENSLEIVKKFNWNIASQKLIEILEDYKEKYFKTKFEDISKLSQGIFD